MTGKRKIVFISLACLLVVLIGGVWVSRIRAKAPVQTRIQAVTVKDAKTIEKQDVLELTGSVDALQTAVISAKTAGRTAEVLADNGEQVAAGQTLVKIEDADYVNALAASQAVLDKAQSNLANMKTNYQRYQELYKNGSISQKDYEDLENGLKAAQADADAATASAASAAEALKNTSISTPIPGLAANRNVKVGQFLATGTPVMVVEDISSVYVIVKVQQKDIQRLKVGLDSGVTVDAYPDKKFTGLLKIINPVADPSSRVFECKVQVENPEGLLRPGMFARCLIKVGENKEVLAVPLDALSSNQGLYYVFIPNGQVVKQQPVEIGDILGTMVEIKSGLSAGQPVVVSNVNKLKDQDSITVSGGMGE